jgi:hypothetical protein
MTADDIPADPSPAEPAAPSRELRRWVRRALVGLAALAALYLATVFVLSRFLDPVRLADWMEPRIAAAVNRDVAIGTASVRLLPFELNLGEVEVSDPTGLAPSLARVDALALRVRLIPLLRREVRIDRITLEAPSLTLQVDADGLSNFGDLSPETRPPPEGGRAPLSLDLRSLRVERGSILYASGVDSSSVEVTDVSMESSVRRGEDGTWQLAGSSGAVATVTSARGVDLEGLPVEATFDVEADAELDGLVVRQGTVGVEGVILGVSGEVDRLKDPVRQVGLDVALRDLPLDRLVSFLPDSVRGGRRVAAGGSLSAELRVEGGLGPDTRPTVTGQASVVGGSLRLSEGALAEDVSGRVTLAADGSVTPSFAGALLGGPASVEGSLTGVRDGTADLRIRTAARLDRLGPLGVLPEGVTLAGRLQADVRVVGAVLEPDRLQVHGDVEVGDLRGTHPEVGVPVGVPTGRIRLEGSRATFRDLQVALGEDVLVTSGEIRNLQAFLDPDATPWLEGRVRGPHLSLLRLRAEPPPDTTLTYGRVAFARVGGLTVRGRTPDEAARELGLARPDSLPLAGRMEVLLDTLVDRRGSSLDVRAQVEFGPRYLRVTESSFRRYGGELSSRFNLSLGADDTQPFTMALAATEVDAGEFLGATTPLGSLVRGKITLEMEASGSLDRLLLPTGRSLVGAGRYLVSGGGLAATPVTRELASFLGIEELREPTIRNWGTSFILEDGVLRLADATVEGAPGTPQVGGGIALDGGLDLLAAFALPAERMDASSLERLGVVGDVAARMRQREDVVQAVLRIGGSVRQPALRADAGSPVRTLAEAAREETEREVQQRIEDQRKALEEQATGFLRGFLQRRDTVRPPVDTLRVDSLAADTLRRDTIPGDTLRRDTIPADTTRPDTVRADAPRPRSRESTWPGW